MFTLTKETSTLLEVKQSKFITHLVPYSNYEETLKHLKAQHPKARHFVVAYRYFNEYDQIVEHSSDDGEPKGTSGKPSLMALSGAELINVGVIVVRYFGGTKLGTGGLVRAYSDVVNLAINEANLVEYVKTFQKSIEVSYADERYVTYEAEAFNVRVLNKEFGNNVVFKLEASKEDLEALLQKLERVVL